MTIITTVVIRIGNRSRWWNTWKVDRPETKASWQKSIKMFISIKSMFISKHKISKSSSFLNVISPDVEAISWFFGSILLVFTFSFNKTQPTVNSSNEIGWIIWNMKFLQPLQDWCEKFIRSMFDRMMSPSLLNISPKKKKSLLMLTVNATQANQ